MLISEGPCIVWVNKCKQTPMCPSPHNNDGFDIPDILDSITERPGNVLFKRLRTRVPSKRTSSLREREDRWVIQPWYTSLSLKGQRVRRVGGTVRVRGKVRRVWYLPKDRSSSTVKLLLSCCRVQKIWVSLKGRRLKGLTLTCKQINKQRQTKATAPESEHETFRKNLCT